jgi:hypothetical protein
LGTKSTTNLSEGTNLYYTTVRADSDILNYTGNLDGRDVSVDGARLDLLTGTYTLVDSARLDSIDSDTTVNNAKISNATHTGDVAGSTTLTIQSSAISGRALATPDSDYYILAYDDSDGTLKKISVLDLGVSGGGGATNLNGLNDVTLTSEIERELLVRRGSSWVNQSLDSVGILKDSDIGVSVQAYSAILAATTGTYTLADSAKLDGIEANANNYTTFNSDFDTRLGTKSTTNLSEGTNLYYTTARADSDATVLVDKTFVDALGINATQLGGQNSAYHLAWGNFTGTPTTIAGYGIVDAYDSASFDGDLAASTTTNLSEGSNLYYTKVRTDSDIAEKIGVTVQAYDATIVVDADIGSTVQGHSAVLDATTGTYTLADSAKLDGIEAGANNYTSFNSDFDTRLDTKSTSDLSEGTKLYYTKVRVDSDVAAEIGVTLQAQSSVLDATSASFTTALKTQYDSVASNYQHTNQKGVANGYASLDGSGLVPSGELPSYVDDVLEYADSDAFPGTGEQGKIYVATDNNSTYRWTGSVYVNLGNPIDFASQAEAEGGTENTKAMTSLRSKQAFDQHLSNASTTNLSEGTKLYYTKVRVDSDIAEKIGVTVQGYDATIVVDADIGSTVQGHSAILDATTGTYTLADSAKLDGIEANANNYISFNSDFDTRLGTKSTTNLSEGTKLYYTKVRVDSDVNEHASLTNIHLDWTQSVGTIHADNYTNTTYSPATATVAGLIELEDNTVQSVAANAVTTTASRTYGLQVNGDGQGVINVPWTDTTYSVGDGGLTEVNFTTADNAKLDAITGTYTLADSAKLDGIEAGANNYTSFNSDFDTRLGTKSTTGQTRMPLHLLIRPLWTPLA